MDAWVKIAPAEPMEANRNLKPHLLLSFIFGFAAIFTLYAGLPLDFSADFVADHDRIRMSSYGRLLGWLVNPTTPAWFFYVNMPELRPVSYLVHKSYYDLFGLHLLAGQIFLSFAHGLLLSVFFYLAHRITQSRLYAWLLIILYASFPTNRHLFGGYIFLEFQFVISLLMMTALISLLFLSWKNRLSVAQKLLLYAGWILPTWIAINWRSSEKILPFVFLGFLIVQLRPIVRQAGRPRWTGLLLINLAMFIWVVPISPAPPAQVKESAAIPSIAPDKMLEQFSGKENKMFRFSLNHMIARTFVMPGSVMPADNPLLTVRLDKDKQPATFTADLGFFLGWFFWLSLAAMPFFIWRLGRNPFLTHAMILNVGWFLAVIAGFANGSPLGELRYLNYALVPAVPLLAFMVRSWHEVLLTSKVRRRVGQIVFTGILAFTIYQNFDFLVGAIKFHQGMYHAVSESEKMIFKDFFRREPEGLELYSRHREIEDRVVLVSWYAHNAQWYENAKKRLEAERILFLKSHREDDKIEGQEILGKFRGDGYNIEKLGEVFLYDNPTPYFQTLRLLAELRHKRMKDREIIVYKITPPPPAPR